MEQLNTIKELISQGNVEQAILLLDELLQTDFPQKDEAYYLRGNAYRKQSNWQQALNNYRYAIDLNPDSPARPHTHPLTQRAGCRAELYETQLPLHVCQRGLLGHP